MHQIHNILTKINLRGHKIYSDVLTILGALGICIIGIGVGLVIFSHYIKNHAEKFKDDKAMYVKQKLNMALRDLIIGTISDGINEFDFLSDIIRQSGPNQEAKKMLEELKNNILSFLVENKELTGFKTLLSKIINKIIENPDGYRHIRKVAGNFLTKVDKYNSIEEKYESSYTSELKESKNIFLFSIGFIVIGLTIVIYSLYGCTLTQINYNYFSNLFFILYIEGLMVLLILARIIRLNMEKKKAQKEILKIEQEAIDITPIGPNQ